MELFNAGHIDNQVGSLYLVSDIHIGCGHWAKEQFDTDMKAIIEDPFAKVVINGDTLQKDLRTSVGDIYGQVVRPGEQKYVAEKLLTPIADKIVGISGGNHDEGSRIKEDSTDIKDLCKFLGVHYFQDEISFRLSVGRDKYGNPAVWSFYGIHGVCNGMTIGSIANSLKRLCMVCDADVYFMGHTHQTLQFPDVFFRRDIIHEKMMPVVKHYICSASYQGADKFPITHAMQPKTVGCPKLTLQADSKKITVELPTGICVQK